jgi:cytochrome c556
MQARRIFSMALAALTLAVSGVAFAQAVRTPAESVEYRHQQFRRIGATFKMLNEGVRGGSPDLAALRTNAQTLNQLAQDLPNWFPAGSGAESGVRTRATAEIWSNSAAFADQAAQFRTATQALAAADDVRVIGGQLRAVGARCASCHQAFRAQE